MSTLTEAAEAIARAELARLGEAPSSIQFLLDHGVVRVVDPPNPQPLEKL